MTHELAPLVTMVGLVARSDDPATLHDATVDGVSFVATMTGIGMRAAADATARVLAAGVDHVIVVGIAGASRPISRSVPSSCRRRCSTRRRDPPRARPNRRCAGRGLIRSSDDFLTDDAALEALVADGVVALDMETAAVAAVCEAAGVPWSVFRSISDRHVTSWSTPPCGR